MPHPKTAFLSLQSYPGSVNAHIYPVLKISTWEGGPDPNERKYESVNVMHELDRANARKLNKEKTLPGEPPIYEAGVEVHVCFTRDEAIEHGTKEAKSRGVDVLFIGNPAAAVPKGVIYGPDEVEEMFEGDERPDFEDWLPVLKEVKSGNLITE